MDRSETTKATPATPTTTAKAASTAAATASASARARADEPPNAPKPKPRVVGPGLGPGPGPGSAPAMSSSAPYSSEPLPPLAVRAGHELPFVQPSSYLRPNSHSRAIPPITTPMSPIDEEQMQGLKGVRDFLRVRTSYDVLPLSFRLIILDNDLLIKKSLNILIQNGIVSAPLWDSYQSKFAGLLTATDYINLIQYYCQYPEHIDNVDKFRLSSLRDIEKAIGLLPMETVSVHPSKPLYEACSHMLRTRARRIPLVDIDDETGRETVVSVITQYRILKFIAVNTEQYTSLLKKTVREIGLGTYTDLKTGSMTQPVLDIINIMVTNNISAVPIVDKNNVVLNVFEAIDVIPIIKTGVVEELEINVGEALCKRGDEFGGIFTCQEDDRLDSIFITLRQSRLHRLVVIDDNWHLKGVISLSDILKYVLFHGDEGGYFPSS
ncbi:putative nuclear protein SNF4 [Rosellinia necatrix]|uniref:Putative nuclear protein SNF4 n=1 Tax=Rosellinia necatrix TaxID=77044 RepID=A0A1S7ULT0_ROSNE|nr:putative nuclear protein SNF4 [Rosellinia necatrix]